MELANTTALPARVFEHPGGEPGMVTGWVVAKATFRYAPDGAVSLDTDNPFPLFDDDERTPFGFLPRDDLARGPEGFEVIFLGSAHAPRGAEVAELVATLRVGEVARSLAVVGDRFVEGGAITAPRPFRSMDLGWSNAFGGACEVLVDRDAPVVLADVRNPAGKGFDPTAQARALCEALRAPKGYPVLPSGPRALPNVEHPGQRIARPDDAPEPAGWATLPLSRPAHATRMLDLDASQREGSPVFTARAFHRAVDAWIIDPPPPGAEVSLTNLDPAGEVRFALPPLEVACDFLVGDHATSLGLVPETLAIVGPWRRFTVTYRARFHYWEEEGEMTSARLRTREGAAR